MNDGDHAGERGRAEDEAKFHGRHSVQKALPDDTVVEAALALAERITVNAPLAVWASKRVAAGIDGGVVTGDEAGWNRTMREMGAVLRSADAKEGPRAFAEKREPVWQAK